MSCRAVMFALDTSQTASLLALVGRDQALLAFVQEIEEAWDSSHLCELDKSWDALHRCFTDGGLRVGQGRTPLERAIMGGQDLLKRTGLRRFRAPPTSYIMTLVAATETSDIAAALRRVERPWLTARYESLPSDYGPTRGPEDLEYTWAYLLDLRDFYAQAAADGRAVLFTVDQ